MNSVFEHKYENMAWQGYTKFLPEVIAVRIGVKPVMRIPVSANFGYKKFSSLCESLGLVTSLSDYTVKAPYTKQDVLAAGSAEGDHFMYVSLKQELIEEAKKYDLHDQDRFGKLMGYPQCCIDYYQRVSNSAPQHEVFDYFQTKRPFFWQNNYLLRFNTHYYLHAYFICSFDCWKSRKKGDEIFQAIGDFDETYARKIEYHLKLPILLDETMPGGIMHNWDRLKGIVFNGELVGARVYYKGQFSLWQGSYFPVFAEADSAEITGSKIILRKNSVLTRELPRTDHSFFMRFE